MQSLHEEMLNWPFLNDEETLEKGQKASYATITDTGEEPGQSAAAQRPHSTSGREAAALCCGVLHSVQLAATLKLCGHTGVASLRPLLLLLVAYGRLEAC